MSETNARYGRLITLLAAGSLLGACSQGMGEGGRARRYGWPTARRTPATSRRRPPSTSRRSTPTRGRSRRWSGSGAATPASASTRAPSRRWSRRRTGGRATPRCCSSWRAPSSRPARPQAALENLDVALRKRPRDVAIITARGIALDRLSRHAEAQETYRRGLAIDPTNFVLLSNLGLSLGLSGRPGEGITILRELVRDGAATANTRGNLALVYGLAGREREASATLAVDLSPSQIQNNLAYYRELREMLRAGQADRQPRRARAKPAAKPRGNAVGKAPAGSGRRGAEAARRRVAATAPAPGAPRGGAVESLGIMEPAAAPLAPRPARAVGDDRATAEAAIDAVEAAPVVLSRAGGGRHGAGRATPARAGAQ